MSEMVDGRVHEQRRVNQVINEIEKKEETLLEKSGGLKESVLGLRKSFFDDVTVNLDDPDEVIETHASIKQQAELLSERERSHGIIDKQLKVLRKLKNSPYFGRIDFFENGEKNADKIYIGIASLMDNKDEEFLIYDWRAPISSMYYDYQPGKAQFETMSGVIDGDILLKRQFVIKDGLIEGLFDTGITIGDELLQRALGNNASNVMKSIVATIQKEQNKIIRNEKHKYLIVQGVAGSGKTSAALQRVAYLMYRYREILHEDNIVLFSPNPLFNSYVSNVLPELGEANMRQTTFLEYVSQKIEDHLTIETSYEQMEFILTDRNDATFNNRSENIKLKSSLSYKKLLDEFISGLRVRGLIFKDVLFKNNVLISKEEISNYFYALDQELSIPNALLLVQQWLLKQINRSKLQEIDQDWVMEEVELMDEEEFLQAAHHAQAQEEIDEFYDSGIEETFLREKVIESSFASIEMEVKSFDFLDVFLTYRSLFQEWIPEDTPKHWSQICAHSLKDLNEMHLSWEDVTPYVYVKEKLLGEHTDRSVRHLFIDEAQDYTAFQLAYIKHIFPHTRMTFLGDINQAILAHTAKGNPLIADYDDSYERIELTKSYRSTKQIVQFTKWFLPSGDNIQPFDRDGEKPQLIIVENSIVRNEQIVKYIHALLNDGHETIAIICKTATESDQLYRELKDKISLHKMDETTTTFDRGVLILPIYLAKGIEFDAVVIPDASNKQYGTEFERTLFYTACTRAMHTLVMFSEENYTSFILEAPAAYYEINSN